MPLRELKRLQAVERFLNIKLENEEEVRKIVRLAAEICDAESASVTILDSATQHFRYRWGLDLKESRRKDAFCNYTIQQEHTMVVQDASNDPRFSDNPLVTGAPYIHFYAGAPLVTHDSQSVGSLCVLDRRPRQLSNVQVSMLTALAKQLVDLFEFRASISLLRYQLQQVKNSEIRLRSFFESKMVLHLLLDKDFRIVTFNTIFAQLVAKNYSMTMTPKMGDDIRLYLYKDTGKIFMENYLRALEGERNTQEFDMEYENEHIYWSTHFEPAYDAMGEIIGVSCNAMDITEKIVQDQLLKRQNDSLRQVAFYQSHELRRPVSSILGLADYMAENYAKELPDEIRLMKFSALELDQKIRQIVKIVDEPLHPIA